MARTARASAGGVCCHAINRGNTRAEVFHKPEEDAASFKLMQDVHKPLPLRRPAWRLVPNHFD